jgi:serine/threonine-protein kinase
MTTGVVGKHAYTPPEQFREETSVQSDIYALGATMYFLLTGLDPKPLSKSNPASKNPAVSPGLGRIVERATELDLTRRYEEISWLKLDLAGH